MSIAFQQQINTIIEMEIKNQKKQKKIKKSKRKQIFISLKKRNIRIQAPELNESKKEIEKSDNEEQSFTQVFRNKCKIQDSGNLPMKIVEKDASSLNSNFTIKPQQITYVDKRKQQKLNVNEINRGYSQNYHLYGVFQTEFKAQNFDINTGTQNSTFQMNYLEMCEQNFDIVQPPQEILSQTSKEYTYEPY